MTGLEITRHWVSKIEIIEVLNNKHAVLQVNGKTFILNEEVEHNSSIIIPTYSKESDFRSFYRNQKLYVKTDDDHSKSIPIASIWLNHGDRRQYAGIIFEPYAPGSAPSKEEKPKFYNLFQGWSIQPVKGECNLFWDHLLFVICCGDEELCLYIRKWMAHAIQRPWELPEVALVLIGLQGTGKGRFVYYFGKLFGPHYLHLTKMEGIIERFNASLENKILVNADEAVWSGKNDSIGFLKGLITEETLTIEKKYIDKIQVRNCIRLIITTNEKFPVPLDLDDRRYVVLEISDIHKEDHSYFRALNQQMESGGLKALMYDLLQENLNDFEIREKPTGNYDLTLKLKSSKPHVRWWVERLEDSISWKASLSKDELYESYSNWCQQNCENYLGKPTFFKEIQSLTPNIDETRPTLDGKRVRWLTIPNLNICRQHFEGIVKKKITWPDNKKELGNESE